MRSFTEAAVFAEISTFASRRILLEMQRCTIRAEFLVLHMSETDFCRWIAVDQMTVPWREADFRRL
jgi:hypothetical protein